jgi:selenocysteine lyase/cysteine desulfurase
MARHRGIVSIVDGGHAVGHFPFALRDLECDAYGTSLHKWLMAPHGTGLLYVRRDTIGRIWPLMPALDAVRDDIRKFEEIGTHVAAAQIAVGDALAFHQAIGAERKAARLRYLTLRWVNALNGQPGVRILSNIEPGQTWGLATFDIDGINAPALVKHLFDRHRIIVSAVVNQGRPGPVLEYQGVRVTPNIYSSLDEIDRFVAAVGDVVKNGLPRPA